MSSLGDLGINLLASVIAGLAVFAGQRFRQRRTIGRKRRFFGAFPGRVCMICAPRHTHSDNFASISRFDVVALVEAAATIKDCGADIQLVGQGDYALLKNSLGDRTEFCIGGPDSNARMAAHLRTFLPGVRQETYREAGGAVPIHVAGSSFAHTRGEVEYVLVAKIAAERYPVFVVSGQTAVSNGAAVRYLSANYRNLAVAHGTHGGFCFVLKVVNSAAYGDRKVELVGDFTDAAFVPAPSDPAPSDPGVDRRFGSKAGRIARFSRPKG